MLESTSKELLNIKRLIKQAKFEKALELIRMLETSENNTPKDQLSLYILKGRIFCHKEQYKQAVKIGEQAYQLSQKIGSIPESIDSLIISAFTTYLGNIEEAYNKVKEAEQLIKLISKDISVDVSKLEADLLYIKMVVYHYKTDHTEASNLANKWLSLRENTGGKLELSRVYNLLVDIFLMQNNPNTALDYSLKSLELQKELENPIGIAKSFNLVATCYFRKGDFDQALVSCKQSLISKEISDSTKIAALHLLGAIYKEKGNIDRTLRYYSRAAKLAKEEEFIEAFIENIVGIGATYRMKRDFDQAIECLRQSLDLSKKFNISYGISSSLFYLILVYLDKEFLEDAHSYMEQLEEFAKNNESHVFNQLKMIAKALVLKRGGRIRNITEAEDLLIDVVKDKYAIPQFSLLAIVNLCDLYLQELSITDNIEILEDIYPLITHILKIAEKQNSYLWLAETKLLQAKMALLRLDIEEAELLLTQAQQIAELHGLDLLAIKISLDHDNLLEQLNEWNNLKRTNAPISERIKLASFEGVINRMKGKSAIETTELTHEAPILLLIIAEGGLPLFSNPFIEDWQFEDDLISGFLTAFNTFSGELFEKKLDRAKFGEYTILMHPVSSFSICYLFKGQTYLAKQKLARFVEQIQKVNTIWKSMNNFYKNNRILELSEHPLLETLINQIFLDKIPEYMFD